MYENSLKKAWKAKSMSLFSGRSCFGHDSVVLDMRASDMFGHVLDMRASVAFSRNIFGVPAIFSARRPIGPARLHGLISCAPVFFQSNVSSRARVSPGYSPLRNC